MLQQRRQVVSWDDGYVSAGLIARYLGGNNTGQGHSATTTLWKDLIGNADLTLPEGLVPGTRQWGPNYFESLKVNISHFAWASSPLPPSYSPENSTLEVVFMPFAGADSSNGGDVVGIDDVPTIPYTTITLEMQALNASFLVEERANFVVVNRRALTANTRYTVSMPVSPFSPVPALNGSKAIFYNGVQQYRASRIGNFFVQLPEHYLSVASNPVLIDVRQLFFGRIYEVRLYNRALSPEEIAQNAALDLQRYP